MAELGAGRLEPPVEKNLSRIPVTRRIVGQRQVELFNPVASHGRSQCGFVLRIVFHKACPVRA